jgi:hypothetical protein
MDDVARTVPDRTYEARLHDESGLLRKEGGWIDWRTENL